MSESIILVCLPVLNSRIGDVARNSQVRYCTRCECAVWVAPSGLEFLNRSDGDIVCMSCARPMIAADPDAKIEAAPGAFAEVAEHLANERRN